MILLLVIIETMGTIYHLQVIIVAYLMNLKVKKKVFLVVEAVVK